MNPSETMNTTPLDFFPISDYTVPGKKPHECAAATEGNGKPWKLFLRQPSDPSLKCLPIARASKEPLDPSRGTRKLFDPEGFKRLRTQDKKWPNI